MTALRLMGRPGPWLPLVSALVGGHLACPSVAWLTPHVPPALFQAWKAHLMGPAGCTMNLRKTHVLHRPPALPLGKARTLLHVGARMAGSPPPMSLSLCVLAPALS